MLRFWQQHPALFVGLSLLLGTACALSPHYVFAVPAFFLWGKSVRAFLLGGLCALIAYFHAYSPAIQGLPLRGKVRLHIASLHTSNSPFYKSLVYKGCIYQIDTDQEKLNVHIPCRLYPPKGHPRPLGDCDYCIYGSIERQENGLVFKADKKSVWTPIPNTHSFAAWRYKIKNRVRSYLKAHIPHKQSYHLLSALATGDIEDRMLSFVFTRVGLRHLLAISGFHFALVAGLLYLFFSTIVPRKYAAGLLLCVVGIYFFFIGNSPSVQRAWIAISLILLGRLLNLKTSALNALGVALVIEILIDPRQITTYSFQLSFVATCALLLIYTPFDNMLQFLVPKRPDFLIPSMRYKWCYMLLCWMRKTIALTFAVHIATLPLLLYLFHSFSPASLLYNLFFPLGVACVMTLLFIGCFAYIVYPPLGVVVHHVNSVLTSKLLLLTTYIPSPLQYTVHISGLSFGATVTIICSLFTCFIYVRQKAIA